MPKLPHNPKLFPWGLVSIPQEEEFKYFGVLFMRKGKMECRFDRKIIAVVLDCCGEEEAKPGDKAVKLPDHLLGGLELLDNDSKT